MPGNHFSRALPVAALLSLLASCSNRPGAGTSTKRPAGVAVVELFTSEG